MEENKKKLIDLFLQMTEEQQNEFLAEIVQLFRVSFESFDSD